MAWDSVNGINERGGFSKVKSAGLIQQLLYVLLVVGLFSCPVRAQSQQIAVEGRVLDASRAPVAGAKVSVTLPGGGAGPSAVSGTQGEFALQLPPGSHTLAVQREGFAEESRTLTLTPGASAASTEFVLQVASVRSLVTVTGSVDYQATATSSATRTLTPLRDVPQSIAVVTQAQVKDQMMTSIGDVMRYIPGISVHQGENNRDQIIIRGNSTSADFFLNGVRDDVQYYRDLYNIERIEALKGPNAMIFGRGGGGGLVNRVSKEANFTPLREVSFQGGSFAVKRFTSDLNQPLGNILTFRVNGVYENSGSFRDSVSLGRYAFNPTFTIAAGPQTKITVGYERLNDTRVADRGMTSFQGRPVNLPISTFYGNPDDSHVRATVNLGSVSLEHQVGRWGIHNRTLFGGYDRFYQNYVPGAVINAGTQVNLTAYNNATKRVNMFNQTDFTVSGFTAGIRHTVMFGAEFGGQLTDNFRNTGFFNNTATTLVVPFDDPTITTPVTFRQSATDADNHLKTVVAATYVQDQVELSRYVQVVAGLRYDNFNLRYHNNRNDDALQRVDNLLSPRAGIVIKPVIPLSIYANYSVSYLPSSGDQFSSLTTVTQQVKPEKFSNYEVGAKWDATRNLSLTTAIYRLDRTNTRSTDPNDPTRIVQTGATRTYGYEIALNGNITRAWRLVGGYAYQNAYIASATTAAFRGAQVAQVPHHEFSLWNNYQITSRFGAGLGLLKRSDMWATIDNTVVVPGYIRADAAVYVSLTERIRFQANIENLFNTRYFINADSNTNISPGSGIGVRAGVIARF